MLKRALRAKTNLIKSMKIIIPMAGRGSRLRPHTLTVPKPLLPIAGKPMVQRLVEDLSASFPRQIEEVAFVIGDFGKEVEKQLVDVAQSVGAKGTIYHQEKPLGTAHAIYCAHPSMTGNCIVAFSDTLFKASFDFDPQQDGIIWVKEVDDPSSFGVVKLDGAGLITDFVEKPKAFVSNLAIVGIYYFRESERLLEEIRYLLDNDIKEKGEYQLTNALERLRSGGVHFTPAPIEEWLDCGNKNNVLDTNARILELKQNQEVLISPTARLEDTVLIPPCYIGDHSVITHSVIGPHVSIGSNSRVEHSVIQRSLIQTETTVRHTNLNRSMIGSRVSLEQEAKELSVGDFSVC